LYSPKFNQIYIGFTSNLPNRFLSHNELDTKGRTTKYRPWTIAHIEEPQIKKDAIQRKNYLKIHAREKIRTEYYS